MTESAGWQARRRPEPRQRPRVGAVARARSQQPANSGQQPADGRPSGPCPQASVSFPLIFQWKTCMRVRLGRALWSGRRPGLEVGKPASRRHRCPSSRAPAPRTVASRHFTPGWAGTRSRPVRSSAVPPPPPPSAAPGPVVLSFTTAITSILPRQSSRRLLPPCWGRC